MKRWEVERACLQVSIEDQPQITNISSEEETEVAWGKWSFAGSCAFIFCLHVELWHSGVFIVMYSNISNT